jgi:hypothetical protein
MFPFTVVPAYNLPVYASQRPLPDATQDSVRGCSLGFAAAVMHASYHQILALTLHQTGLKSLLPVRLTPGSRFAFNRVKAALNDEAHIRHTILVAGAVGFEEDLSGWMPDAAVVLTPVPAAAETFL